MARAAKTKPKPKIDAVIHPIEIEPIISAFSTGDRIRHAMFGDGHVTAVSDNTLTIAFEKFGSKNVLDSYVKPA